MDILEELDTLRLGPSEYKIVQKAYTEIERLREALSAIAVSYYEDMPDEIDAKTMWVGCTQIARFALQQTQPSHAQMSDDKGQR